MRLRIDALLQIGGNTALSRILGFARDLVIARLFGAGGNTDAFLIALRIPNFFRRLFVEGVFAAACLPVLAQRRARRGPVGLKNCIDCLFGTLGAYLLGLTLLALIAAPLIVLVFAPGFGLREDRLGLTADLLRLTLPYLLLISLTALAGAVLNLHDRFGIPSVTPAFLNLSILGCALFLAPHLDRPILALAWGVLVGGLVQLGIQIPALVRIGVLPRLRFCPREPGVRRVLRRFGPALLALSSTQLSLILDTVLASFLLSGSISWLYYSERLMEFPLGILGAALGLPLLPRLARTSPGRSPDPRSPHLDEPLRWAVLLGVPAAVGLGVLAQPILTTLFHSPAFGPEDVIRSAQSLGAYAFGLVAFLAIRILASGCFAQANGYQATRIARRALGVKLLLSLILVVPLGHVGLALATSLGAWFNAGLLLATVRRAGRYRPERGWLPLMVRVLGAALVMGAVLHLYWGAFALWHDMAPAQRLIQLLGVILLGIGLYGGTFFLLGGRLKIAGR